MNQQRRTSVRRDRVTKTPHKQGLQTTDEDVAKKEIQIRLACDDVDHEVTTRYRQQRTGNEGGLNHLPPVQWVVTVIPSMD